MLKKIGNSRYFDFVQVMDHSFMAIKTNPLAMGNAGMINLGDKVVIFDTFLSLEAAQELKQIAIELTGKKEFLIINSHSHIDHFMGNSVFDDSVIISSAKTRENILELQKSLSFGEDIYTGEIQNLEEKLRNSNDVDEILDTENSLIIYRNLNNPDNKIIPPNVSFSNEMMIHGSIDNFLLQDMGIAHSPSDVMGTLMKEKVAYIGDILFVDEHPFLGTGDPNTLKRQLHLLLESDIEYFIPGHGPVAGKENILDQLEYIDAFISLVEKYINETEKLAVTDLPKKFHSYTGPAFRWNVHFLSEYLK